MYVFFMKLSADLQAWGTSQSFDVRKTELEPTKSGIIGMLGAALGIPRGGDFSRLTKLRFGVRVDKEGTLLRDYHTVEKPPNQSVYKATNSLTLYRDIQDRMQMYADHRIPKHGESWITERYYLAYAEFLVAVESEDHTFLEELQNAVRNPVYPLYYGRKCCVPGQPPVGKKSQIVEGTIEEVFSSEPLISDRGSAKIRAKIDCNGDDYGCSVIRDMMTPNGGHTSRFVKEYWVDVSKIGKIMPCSGDDSI